MLQRAKEKDIYERYICDYITDKPLDIDPGKCKNINEGNIVNAQSIELYDKALQSMKCPESPKVKFKLHYGRCTGRFLGLPHGTTPAAVTTNKI